MKPTPCPCCGYTLNPVPSQDRYYCECCDYYWAGIDLPKKGAFTEALEKEVEAAEEQLKAAFKAESAKQLWGTQNNSSPVTMAGLNEAMKECHLTGLYTLTQQNGGQWIRRDGSSEVG